MIVHGCPTRQSTSTTTSIPTPGWVITSRPLGQGSSGTVYDTCMNGKCEYASKFVPITTSTQVDEKRLQDIISIQNEMAGPDVGLSPHMLKVFECSDIKHNPLLSRLVKNPNLPYRVEIMEKVHGDSLRKYMNTYNLKHLDDEQCEALATSIEKMHNRGILHGDLHLENILRESGKEKKHQPRYKIIDWDRASRAARWKSKIRTSQKWEDVRQSLVDICPTQFKRGIPSEL